MQGTDYILDTVIPPDGYFAPYIVWNPEKTSQKLKLSDDMQICTASEGHGFKTVLADYEMLPGNRYYFEIHIIKGNLIKIGISKGIDFLEEAFSDNENGWAIYNGELRHNSNSVGPKYGSLLKSNDTVGVIFDTIDVRLVSQGTLSFSINRKDYGVAYKDIQFTQGPFYPAVALIYKNDSFRLKTLVKED